MIEYSDWYYLAKRGENKVISCILLMLDSDEEKRKVERLYERFNRLMYVVAYNIVQHHEDAEDVVLTSWIKIIRHLEKINEKEELQTKSFFVIVVERAAIDLCRKNKRRKEVYLEELESSPYLSVTDIAISNIEIMQWIHSLPKKYAEVLLLYYVNEFSQKEIADILGITVNSVAIRICRGRKLLQREYL